MLTRDDRTVPEPLEVWREIADTGLRYVGVKDVGIDGAKLKRFADAVHASGAEVMLELVSDGAEAELASARAGLDAGVDYLIGGSRVDDVLPLTRDRAVRYMPFAGEIRGHPLVLVGDAELIAADARRLADLDGVDGVDLLAFRHEDDPEAVIEATVAATAAPVIVAGSVDSPERARRVSELGAWGFTVGTAIFAGTFAPSARGVREQVEALLESSGDPR
jgi:2,4-dienoyl-CoA reductase-like NADH-dependent reductase (Old Yellow Enzyme family)